MAGTRRDDPGDARSQGTIAALEQTLRHPRQQELAIRLAEIFQGRPYLRHGVDVRPGDVVLDAGANIGVASAFFAVECRAGVIHSFEPIEPIYRYLERNLRQFPACVPHNHGLGSRSGPSRMTYYPDICEISGLLAVPSRDRANLRQILLNEGGSQEQVDEGLRDRFTAREVTCELRTVSDVLRTEALERVDLLKLDVEGAELGVLEGIDDSDWGSIRQISGELHLGPAETDRFLTMLRDRGYQVTVEQEASMAGTPFQLFYAVPADERV